MNTYLNNNRIDESKEYTPFNDTEEAWFWFCRYQAMRDEAGSFCRKSSFSTIQRPCDLDDIIRVVLKLRLAGHITQRHVDILIEYGSRFTTPDIHHADEVDDYPLWNTAIDLMTTIFIQKGIVQCKPKH